MYHNQNRKEFKHKMTNIERLTLELEHREYFTKEEYSICLEENGLEPAGVYSKATNELGLLQTVIAVLQALNNNIDLFMKIQSEFTTTTSAYRNLKDRIDELNKRIALIPSYEPTVSQITYLYHN